MTTYNLLLIEAPHNVHHFIYILHLWSFDIIICVFFIEIVSDEFAIPSTIGSGNEQIPIR